MAKQTFYSSKNLMKLLHKLMGLFFLLLIGKGLLAQKKLKSYNAIISGIPWFDNQGRIVSAHGANIIKENGKYYLFGEAHSDTSNAFVGFNCYSSKDLYNWKFESVALPVQSSGRLGHNRVGERVKVMKCPETGEYIMFMHTDTLSYRDPCICYATSSTINGVYKFEGPLLMNGKPIKKWDMGTFQDNDGVGYLLIHGGDIYKLSRDYKRIVAQVAKNIDPDGESPAMFKRHGIYYYLSSNRTSWERNDNYYFSANSIKGPWHFRGIFAPKGTLTWNAQTTFVLPIQGALDTSYMFMGDRWSFPLQASAATYVWQPISFIDTSISLSNYLDAWQVNNLTGRISQKELCKGTIDSNDKIINYSSHWSALKINDTLFSKRSNVKGASFSIKFDGRQIGFYSLVSSNGGYGKVVLFDKKGHQVLNCIVDMYSKYTASALKFLSPILSKNQYVLTVTVLGKKSNWSDKRKSDYGSTGEFVSIEKAFINN